MRLQQTAEENQTGSGQPLESFFEDSGDLSVQEFEAKHGSAFLLLSATGIGGPQGVSGTEVRLDSDSDPRARTADLSVLVVPLRSAPGAPGDLITIGREQRNDAVVPDASISRFHAFLKRTPEGQCLLQDAGSTNGSMVNGATVLTRGSGEPTPLKPGDTVRLGQLEFTFLDAAAFRNFALAARG